MKQIRMSPAKGGSLRKADKAFLAMSVLFLLTSVVLRQAQDIALAQSGGLYDLTWSTVDGGGGVSTGGDYTLRGIIGQPDAGAMSGGDYTLAGGFWPDAAIQYDVYLPLVLRLYVTP